MRMAGTGTGERYWTDWGYEQNHLILVSDVELPPKVSFPSYILDPMRDPWDWYIYLRVYHTNWASGM